MATYWTVRSQRRSPEDDRKATLEVRVASYGVMPPPRTLAEAAQAQTTPIARFEVVLAQVVGGLVRADPPTAWVAHPPAEARALHGALTSAWREAKPAYDDEDRGWWETQYGALDAVLTHAVARGEWVVSVHEFVARCYERGGIPREAPSDRDPFDPPCEMPAPRATSFVPLGVTGGVLLAGFALLAWRHRRLAERRDVDRG